MFITGNIAQDTPANAFQTEQFCYKNPFVLLNKLDKGIPLLIFADRRRTYILVMVEYNEKHLRKLRSLVQDNFGFISSQESIALQPQD